MRPRNLALIISAALFASLTVAGPASAAGVKLEAKLKGSQEPSGGDPNGSGTAEVNANKKKKKVCFTLTYKKIDDPVAAHIHFGEKGEDGPIVIPLEESTFPSGASGCVKNLDRDLIKELTKNPKGFYANIHTDLFPGGAIRGQFKPVGD